MGSAKASKAERRERRKRDHGDMEMADAEVYGQTMYLWLMRHIQQACSH